MKVIGVIPSRYQSSRYPGKPLALILGKPMVVWVYEQALKAEEIDEVIVATDDERIADCCRQYGMNYMMTGEHKTGADRVAEVASRTDGDIYLNIQGDEPLIEPEAIRQVLHLVLDDDKVEYAALRTRIDEKSEWQKYGVVKAVTDLQGDALYFSRAPVPYNFDKADAYLLVGLYAYRRDFLLEFLSWGQSPLEIGENGVEPNRALEHGRKIRLGISDFPTIGVDLPEQIPEVEEILRKKIES
ncbi:MAG: 3-deoxy-manno-octulosonate cytidylyltransferase [Lachnospiraceae bacterium]|nr:3-deoxy-manno-octulosonate cytidylyltransferase [Lachnospiraceae bacterium]